MKIKIGSIKVDRSGENTKRFRSSFGDIETLSKSLSEHGLIHPIVVDEIIDGVISCAECGGGGSILHRGESSRCERCKGRGSINVEPSYKYVLVAGERRMTAAAMIGWQEIDATIRAQLSAFERKCLELEENIQRLDVNWMERDEAIRQLDELKRAQFGSRQPGCENDVGWTIHDTAKLVGASIGTVSNAIKMARDLQDNPELIQKVSGTTEQIARKMIEREKQAAVIKKKIDQGLINVSAKLSHGDCLELIKSLEDNSINCLITDPPFAVDAIDAVSEGGLASGQYNRGENVGDVDVMTSTYNILLPELYRVMAPGAHFYMFFGPSWYEKLIVLFTSAGFIPDPVPLIWPKNRTTMIPNPYHYVPSYECILYGYKPPRSRTLLKPRANCLQDFPADAGQKRVHPLQKPRDLMKLFIENSTVHGETVLDCFAGSAIVLKTAVELGRRAIGFEKDEQNYLLAMKFLAQGKEER